MNQKRIRVWAAAAVVVGAATLFAPTPARASTQMNCSICGTWDECPDINWQNSLCQAGCGTDSANECGFWGHCGLDEEIPCEL